MKEYLEATHKIKKVDSKESILTSVSSSLIQKKYNKITHLVKTQFLDLIINGNCSIKKAAQILNINYSSSKSIISEFRKESAKTFKPKQQKNLRSAEFKETEASQELRSVLTLITTVGRNPISEQQMIIQPQPVKRVKIFHIIPPLQENSICL